MPMRLVHDPITRRFQVCFGGQPIAVTNRYGDIEVGWSSRAEAVDFLATCRDGGLTVSKRGAVTSRRPTCLAACQVCSLGIVETDA